MDPIDIPQFLFWISGAYYHRTTAAKHEANVAKQSDAMGP
jgi:hypothetical protein